MDGYRAGATHIRRNTPLLNQAATCSVKCVYGNDMLPDRRILEIFLHSRTGRPMACAESALQPSRLRNINRECWGTLPLQTDENISIDALDFSRLPINL